MKNEGVAVKMLQTYETTVMSKDSEHAMQVVVVPSRSLPLPWPTDSNVEDIFHELELKKLAKTDPSNLAHHLAVLFSPQVSQHELPEALANVAMTGATPLPPNTEATKADVRFAEFVSFERIIPFEQSLVSPESLAKLATTASGAGLGAYIGFVAFGSSPILLITVPAGIILCGAARGIGQALEEGLRDLILRWLKGEEKGETAKGGRRRKQGVPEAKE